MCGHLIREHQALDTKRQHRRLGVRVGGPNAGHTIWSYSQGAPDFEYKLRHVPVIAVVDPNAKIALAAGSEVDLEVLQTEMELLAVNGLLNDRQISVDPQATLLESNHISEEQEDELQARLGSTAKGIGAARSARIWRRATTVGELYGSDGVVAPGWLKVEPVAPLIRDVVASSAGLVQIEGVQGYGLGLHAGNYPYCTSSDCRGIDFLAMAGINPWEVHPLDLEIWLVARTNPIRVAGNSGPIANETNWRGLGLPEERTTVTNKVRRVGTWDKELVQQALEANGYRHGSPVMLAVSMLDQLFPEDEGETQLTELTPEATAWLDERETELDCPISMVTTSPHTKIRRGATLVGGW